MFKSDVCRLSVYLPMCSIPGQFHWIQKFFYFFFPKSRQTQFQEHLFEKHFHFKRLNFNVSLLFLLAMLSLVVVGGLILSPFKGLWGSRLFFFILHFGATS